jgi:hypothetical protein
MNGLRRSCGYRSVSACIGIVSVVVGVCLACWLSFAGTAPAQLTILSSGELNGKIQPAECPSCSGGLARRHTLIQSVRLEQCPVILLEDGDITQGTSAEDELRFQTTILAMNEMGYDALNVGELDVALGPRLLANMAERATFPIISANLADAKGERFLPAYTALEREVGGKKLRIAVIGVLSNRVRDYLAKQPGMEIKVLDAEQALGTALARLKNKADLRIVLAHASADEAIAWVEKYPEIDVVLNSHDANRPAENKQSSDKCIVLNTAKDGQYLARLDISLDPSFAKVSHKLTVLELSDTVPDSPVIRRILDSSKKMMIEQGLMKPDAAKLTSGGYYIGSKRCGECHPEEFKVWAASYHAKSFAPLENQKKQTDPACLRCHATGYRFFTGFVGLKETRLLASVGCETCHGVGSNHALNPTKTFGKTRRSDCKSCHDKQNSPRFDYASYRKKIAHTGFRAKAAASTKGQAATPNVATK